MKSTLITPDQSSVAERLGSKGTLRIFFKDTYPAKCGRIPCAIGYCTDEFRHMMSSPTLREEFDLLSLWTCMEIYIGSIALHIQFLQSLILSLTLSCVVTKWIHIALVNTKISPASLPPHYAHPIPSVHTIVFGNPYLKFLPIASCHLSIIPFGDARVSLRTL